jgi:hypothetical protein
VNPVRRYGRLSRADPAGPAVPLGPPRLVTMIGARDALYEFELAAVPSPEWQAVFLRPPFRLTEKQSFGGGSISESAA